MTEELSVTTWQDPIAELMGKMVVMDTQGPLIYIGRLIQATEAFYVVIEADVHDTNDSRASKDLYIVETRDLGVRVNRNRVLVMRSQVASVSLLSDVVD